MAKKIINLETVAAEFEKWRDTKSVCEKIPEHLWAKIKIISGHYSRPTIQKRLGINKAQMRTQGLVTDKPTSNVKTTTVASIAPEHKTRGTFINVAPPIVSPQATHNCIELHRPDGSKLIFNQLNPAQFTQVLAQFSGAA